MKVLVIWLAIALIGVLLYMVPGLLDKWKEGKEGVQSLLDHWKFVGSEGFDASDPALARGSTPVYNCNTLSESCKRMNNAGLAAYINTLTKQEQKNAVYDIMIFKQEIYPTTSRQINRDDTTTCCVADALSSVKTCSGKSVFDKTRDQILSELNQENILSSVNSGTVITRDIMSARSPDPTCTPAYNCNTINDSCKYMNDSGLAAYANTLTRQEDRNAVNTMISITDNTTTCCMADALSSMKTSSGNNLINKTRDQILEEMNKPGILSSVNSGGVNNTNVNMGSNINSGNIGSNSVPSGITPDVGSIFGSNPFMTTSTGTTPATTATTPATTATTPARTAAPATAAPATAAPAPSHPVYPTAKKCKTKPPRPTECPTCPKCPVCPACPVCKDCPITSKDYIRKDSIPCWACKL